jgi:hypothetical protein
VAAAPASSWRRLVATGRSERKFHAPPTLTTVWASALRTMLKDGQIQFGAAEDTTGA